MHVQRRNEKRLHIEQGLLILHSFFVHHNRLLLASAMHCRWRDVCWSDMLSARDAATSCEQRRWHIICVHFQAWRSIAAASALQTSQAAAIASAVMLLKAVLRNRLRGNLHDWSSWCRHDAAREAAEANMRSIAEQARKEKLLRAEQGLQILHGCLTNHNRLLLAS
eukprot:2930251-Amphidinium_carterae.1